MQRISLATYTVRVRPKGRPGEWYELGDVEGDSFFNICAEFFAAMQGELVHDEVAQRLLRAQDLANDRESIWGVLESGAYGYGADLIDSESLELAYERSPSEAELIPFYFMLDAPERGTRAILILQRFGNLGIRTPFGKAIQAHIDTHHPGLKIEINTHVPREVIEYLTEGNLKAIELLSYRVPPNIAGAVHLGEHQAERGHMRTIIKANQSDFFTKPNWLRTWRGEPTAVVEAIGDLGEDYDQLSVQVSYGGKIRTVDLSRPDKIAPYIDITDEIDTHRGHPVLASIHRYAQNLRNDLDREIRQVRP